MSQLSEWATQWAEQTGNIFQDVGEAIGLTGSTGDWFGDIDDFLNQTESDATRASEALGKEYGEATVGFLDLSQTSFENLSGMAADFLTTYQDNLADYAENYGSGSALGQKLLAEAVPGEAAFTAAATEAAGSVQSAIQNLETAQAQEDARLGIEAGSGRARGRGLGEAALSAGAQNLARKAVEDKATQLAFNLQQGNRFLTDPTLATAAAGAEGNVAAGMGTLAGLTAAQQQAALDRAAQERIARRGQTLDLWGNVIGAGGVGTTAAALGADGGSYSEKGRGLQPRIAPPVGEVADAQTYEEERADDFNARLSEGEYVSTAQSVKYHGTKTFDMLEEEARNPSIVTRQAGEPPTSPTRDEGRGLTGAAEGGSFRQIPLSTDPNEQLSALQDSFNQYVQEQGRVPIDIETILPSIAEEANLRGALEQEEGGTDQDILSRLTLGLVADGGMVKPGFAYGGPISLNRIKLSELHPGLENPEDIRTAEFGGRPKFNTGTTPVGRGLAPLQRRVS